MLRRSLIIAAALAVATTTAQAQTTAGMALSVNITRSLGVFTMQSLNFGDVGSSNQDQTLTLAPRFDGPGFIVAGEINRTVAISCPATATLTKATGGSITFTPKFTLYSPTGQQSTYVRGAAGCPSIQLYTVQDEGQAYLAFGGDIVIPQFYTGQFSGVYTISVAYP